MKTMNERDKNEMLDSILATGETYQCKLWATIMADARTHAVIGGMSTLAGSAAVAMGALRNTYCYLGVTESSLNFVIVDTMNVSKVKNRMSIPKDSITKMKVKGSFVPGRKVMILCFGKTKLKISMMSHAIGSDIQGQRENVEKLCQIAANL